LQIWREKSARKEKTNGDSNSIGKDREIVGEARKMELRAYQEKKGYSSFLQLEGEWFINSLH
tara:strand:+ start:575 stop:760 length:186 start_codon:yes stop_codon:yes gene_type:complete